MCNTCGCSAAEDFEAERRYRYGNRYITRDSKGRFKKNVDVGRSLSADRRRKAKTVKGVGQGGSGDYNAESKFDKLSNEIAEQYEKKGKSKEEAERIGKATAYKVGVAKYGKRGMERKARAGRAKSAETFEAYDDNISDRQEWLIGELGGKVDKSMNRSQASDYIKELQGKKSGTWKDAEEFGAEDDVEILYERWKDGELTDEETLSLIDILDYSDSDNDGKMLSHMIRWIEDENSEGMSNLRRGIKERFGAEASCGNCGNALVMNAEGEHSCGCGTEMGAEGERKERKSFAPKMHMITYEEILEEKKKNQNMKDAEGFVDDKYGEMVYVKRPHHVALVRKEVAKRPMDRGFEYPNMHTRENEQGNIWDDRKGFRKMDSKERGLFEEIGGKISDFDVVGTTQDVVSKTGFNIPTGVASIAVVFMAYMTGKKYGN